MEKELKQRFDQIDKKFDRSDKRFDQIDKKFDRSDKRFDQIDKKFDQVDKSFVQVNKTIDKLATMVADGFSQVDKRFEHVDKRFDKVEIDIADVRNELRAEIRSIRTELEELPDVIDRIYGTTINNLFDRVRIIEKKLGIVA